ncbi:hypothetical protein [Streptomyces cylindrosporus]|uniref:Uncharacterized protein n=1 Tax=Streptomyces cylindrosporus TaxID=2927583 RepID=A0ABS9YK31_9ACTN|nr:hypothetical protein [Streptomyces cylindrosporus]MCI3277628.1 hypothetical protein [Streptomyces cylindrosporus]
MPHLYSCPVCRIESRPYALEEAAQRQGQRHRDERHGGDHPHGETIQEVPYQLPDTAQLRILAAIVAVVLFALIIKAF